MSKARAIFESRNEKFQISKDEFLFVEDSNITRRLKLDDIFYADAMGDYVKFTQKEKMYAIHDVESRAMETNAALN